MPRLNCSTTDVWSHDRARHSPQRVIRSQRLVWIADVDRASQSAIADLARERLQVKQSAAGDVNDASPIRQFGQVRTAQHAARFVGQGDRKSTRLNSSHLVISYAVF